MSNYPIHARLKEIEPQIHVVSDFMDFLTERGLLPHEPKREELSAEFFGIDIEAYYLEKADMERQLRSE